MSTQRFHINKRPQLIDLNNDLTNFRLTFECVSIPMESEYRLHVTTQAELDGTDIPSLPFKTVRGKMSGNIIADENKYDNYFLVVCADQEMDLDVNIDIVPIEPKSNSVEETQPPSTPSLKTLSSAFPAGYWTPSNIFFWVAFTVIISFLIYYLFIRKATTTLHEPMKSSHTKSSSQFHSIIDDINDL